VLAIDDKPLLKEAWSSHTTHSKFGRPKSYLWNGWT